MGYFRTVIFIFFFASIRNFVKAERLIKLDTAPSSANPMDKMDTMIHRLDQLERSVNTLKAQCSCETQKFIDTEISSHGFPRPSTQVTSKCSLQNLKICENPGVSEINELGKQIKVLCGSDRWIIVLQRFDGSVTFNNKTWESFKNSIGTVGSKSEFFLGLQHLNDLTSHKSFELRFDLEDFEGVKKAALYSDFSVENEGSAYKLGSLGMYTGDAGDSFSYHQGQGFTTLDRDNDAKAVGSCGEEYNSAGWFKSCMEANLMGRYFSGENSSFKEGIYWETFRGPEYSLKNIKMSIRVKC